MNNQSQPVLDPAAAREKLVNLMSRFVSHVSIKLPEDVETKLAELATYETSVLAKTVFHTMLENQRLAEELQRPACQDTGVLQFLIKCGEHFPYMGQLESVLREATQKATVETPLRHNVVETFDEVNTGKNIGTDAPTILWDIEPETDSCEIYTYMAGGGCSLPGQAMVLMPGEGYEGVAKFVLDRMTSYGLNACPPLYVGVGVATSVETAALLSKKALMRPLGQSHANPKVAKMEQLLEEGINSIGIGPQGFGGVNSVMGVAVETSGRHPSTIGVAVNVGCWSHRRGLIVFQSDLSYETPTHPTAQLEA